MRYDTYRVKTELTEQGTKIEADTAVEIRDRLTKQKRLEVLDQEEEWLARQLDRSVLAPNQIRTVVQAFKDKCLPECVPKRLWTNSPLPQGEGWGEGELLAPTTLTAVAENLIHVTNEDKLVHAAQNETGKEEVGDKEIQKAFKPKADDLIKPFHNPDLRELIEALRKDTDQLIDDSPDTIINAGFDVKKAEGLRVVWQRSATHHR